MQELDILLAAQLLFGSGAAAYILSKLASRANARDIPEIHEESNVANTIQAVESEEVFRAQAIPTYSTPISANFGASYTPGLAENGKFTIANIDDPVYSGYPVEGSGKFVMLTYDVNELNAVDFSQGYSPRAAEDGKFVKLNLDESVGYPGGYGKYAVLTYNCNNYDSRYLRLSGGTMLGDIDMGGSNILNAGVVQALSSIVTVQAALSGVSYIDFNLDPILTSQEGRMYWNSDDGTVNIGMPGGNVSLQVGQEQLLRVHNSSGVDILNGQAVYISGAFGGQRSRVTLADNRNEDTSHSVIGIATENIDNNSNGYVTTVGLVRDIDTSGIPEGFEAYLGTNGNLVSAAPLSPAHQVLIGYCINQHPNNGILYVNVDTGVDLSDVHDILIDSPSNGDILQYSSAVSAWRNVDLQSMPLNSWNVVETSTSIAASANSFIAANATSGDVIIQLPVVSINEQIGVKKVDATANTVTISATPPNLIDGNESVVIVAPYESYTLVSGSTQWYLT